VKALSPEEEKLAAVKIQTLLDKFPPTKNPIRVKLTDKIKDILAAFYPTDKNISLSDVLVVKDDKPVGVLYKQELVDAGA